jgi:hypothetical protein
LFYFNYLLLLIYINLFNNRLLQQNLFELNTVDVDSFKLPLNKRVHLKENLWGGNAFELRLPLASTIPISIKLGSIKATENTPEYYQLLNKLLRTKQVVDGCESVPPFSHHHTYRERIVNYLDDIDNDNDNDLGCEVAMIYFRELELDFNRRHHGGGSGIDVSANTLIITSPNDKEQDDDDEYIEEILNIEEITAEKVIFAPKTLPQMTRFSPNQPKKKEDNDSPFKKKKKRAGIESHDECMFRDRPHITYHQEGIDNLRRCVVEIADSIAVADIVNINSLINWIMEPITLIYMRNKQVLINAGKGVLDWNIGLDVEVRTQNTVICFPYNVVNEGVSCVCINSNLEYTQAWRGLLLIGPGKSTCGN